MEPQHFSIAKCTEYPNSALNWFLHHKQLQEHENTDEFSAGRDKFWERQWSPHMKDWAAFEKRTQTMDHNLAQSCDSPLTSGSSSSLSTWESSFFSWNSESSYTAGRCALQSPELLSGQFSGFSLFNSGINHLEAISKEEDLNGKLKQSTFDASIESSRPLKSELHAVELSKEGIDDGWVSDSGDSQSWVSTSSQELTEKDLRKKVNDMHLGRPAHRHNTLELCERRSSHAYSYKEATSSVSDSCGCDARDFGSEGINANGSTYSNLMSSERLCCAAPRKPSTLIFAPETYQMHSIQAFEPAAHSSEIEILNEWHAPGELFKGHGVQGCYQIAEHEENGCKLTKISQSDSARVGRKTKPRLDTCNHLLPPSADSAVPTSIQSGDKTQPLLHSKSMYSAAVQDRFASSTLHGYLRFAEQNGLPCYSFFVDDSDEVLFARVCGQENRSNKENCDWTYTFHSRKDAGKAKGAWKGRPKKERLGSDLVANMKVPGVCKAKKYQDGHAKEASFVLYDGRGQQQESSVTSSEKPQCQPLKPVFDNTAASQVGYNQPRHCSTDTKANKTSCPNGCASNNTLKDELRRLGRVKNASGLKESCAERLNTCINQQVELAAIVISTSVKAKKVTRGKESKPPLTDTAGWGAKFLDKGSESGWGLNFIKNLSSNVSGLEPCSSRAPNRGRQLECIGAQTTGNACQSSVAQSSNDTGSHSRNHPDLAQKPEKSLSNRKSRLKVDVTVILPAGDHGLPIEDEADGGGGGHIHGPTPLLERWVSGGECECGGWDMGCGLSVFKAETLSLHRRTASVALTRHDHMNWLSPGNPLKVFTQGYKQKKVLVLEILEAGLFSLSFQARFSPLQAFATAVALFHQQITHK